MTVQPGEIHGLVGQNGSGKSTLVKLLSGYHAPDAGGEVHLEGELLGLPVKPAELRRRGMAVVHQDLGLLDDFSVVENVRMGAFRSRRWTRAIRWEGERRLASDALGLLGHEIDPDARVGDLLPADRATVAIARALQHHEPGKGLIMFDESSRALPADSLDHFHALVREVAARGGSVLLVSHQLEEVLSAHRPRDGASRRRRRRRRSPRQAGSTEHDIVKLMLGHELDSRPLERATAPEAGSAPVARATGVRGRLVDDVSFAIGAGEIVGVTGLMGSGFEELPYLLGGARRAERASSRWETGPSIWRRRARGTSSTRGLRSCRNGATRGLSCPCRCSRT